MHTMDHQRRPWVAYEHISPHLSDLGGPSWGYSVHHFKTEEEAQAWVSANPKRRWLKEEEQCAASS